MANVSISHPTAALSPTSQQGEEEMDREAPWYWVMTALAAVLTILGNSGVVFLISTRRPLHVTTNWFILSLAVADWCVGTVIIPSYLLCTFTVRCHFSLLKVFYNLLLYVEVCNVCIMTWDRFIAVTKPLQYRAIMTNKRVLALICVAWLFPAMVSLCPLIWIYSASTKTQDQINAVFYSITIVLFEVIPCVVMLLVYCRIFAIARKHFRQIQLQRIITVARRRSNSDITRRRLEGSAVKAVGFVVLFFIFCYSLSTYRSICNNWKLCNVSALTVQISRLFLFWNSALNFLVYALLKQDIRRALMRCIPGVSSGRTTIAMEPTNSPVVKNHYSIKRNMSCASTLESAIHTQTLAKI